MTKTKSSAVSLLAIAAVVVTAIIIYTMACLLTGNITPVVRVCAMLLPVWFVAELNLFFILLSNNI